MSNPYQSSAQQSAPSAVPRFVMIAFWLYLVTALTRVIGIIVSATQLPAAKQTAKDQLEASGTSTNGVNLDALVQGAFIAGIVVAVLFIAAFVIFDLLMRRGANWARIVLLVVTILGITGIVGGVAPAIGVLASIAAAVLTFLPESNAWFRAVRDNKRAATQR